MKRMVFGRKKKEYNPSGVEALEKATTQKEFPRKIYKEAEKRPQFSMDLMIFSSMNQIGQFIDENAIRGRSGDLDGLTNWKNGLKQFHLNIKSFIVKQEAVKILDDYFKFLDENLDPILQIIPNTNEKIKQTLGALELLTEMLFTARNDLFVKFIEIMNPRAKAYDYAFSSMSAKDREQRIKEGLGNGDQNSE